MYLKSKNKSECCGCSACEQICSKKAISFVQIDNEGFRYPIIDNSKCIHCHLCEDVCPVEYPIFTNSEKPEAYATFIKEIEQRQRSSSGGLFYAISSWILSQCGVVYGAAFDEKLILKHERVSSKDRLDILRGSKYLQSDLGNTFCSVKKDLNNNRWVYFVGTPCQVAGLNNYLRKKYEKLLTSDLVCHGTPSQALFNQHLDYLQKKYEGKAFNYAFRDNEGWGGCEIYEYYSKSGEKRKKKLPSYDLSPYLYSFMQGYTYRESCYECKFAKLPRQGDITLADFWGVKKYFPDIDSSKGVSLIVINSELGKSVWNAVKKDCISYSSTVKDCGNYNWNLLHVSMRPQIRSHIFDDIKKYGYDFIAETTFRCPDWNKKYIRYLIQNTQLYLIVKNIIKDLSKYLR